MLRKRSLVKRDWTSTLQAESIRTSLQHLEIGILSVLRHMSSEFAGPEIQSFDLSIICNSDSHQIPLTDF